MVATCGSGQNCCPRSSGDGLNSRGTSEAASWAEPYVGLPGPIQALWLHNHAAETSLPGPTLDPVHEQRGLSGQCIASGLNLNAAPEVLVEERGLATDCIDEHVLTRMAQRGRIPWRTASGSGTGWAEASIVPVHRFDPKWVSGLNESRPLTRSLLLQ